MLKKYLKTGKVLDENIKKKYANFCNIIIDINWKDIHYNRIAFINKAISKIENCNYLEIGCDNNECFQSINAKNKIGVDPEKGGTTRCTSDDFFKNNIENFDVIFVDGLHTFEQCRIDIINSLKFLNLNGYIFIHDLIPRSWSEENIPRLQTFWTGDIWKVSLELMKSQGIEFNVIIADSGVGVIKKISNKANYSQNYSELKNLKYKDFIDSLEIINFVTPEDFFTNIDKE